MPLNSESTSSHARQEFCLALKAARERKGITLAEIASATKIPASLFAALERGDLRRWPNGLFRRSFFRDYVRMIGLPVAEACDEFVRLFSDEPNAELAKAAAPAKEDDQVNDVRLVLDEAWHGPHASMPSRLLAAVLDAGAVLLLATAFAWMGGTEWPATTAVVALVYFTLATAIVAETPAKWALAKRQMIFDALSQGQAAIVTAWRQGTDAISGVLPADAESADDPEGRTWISDARRVGPAPSPRLRVRIKVPQ
jgi:transcriptional regulator with XRE-family HTH domain